MDISKEFGRYMEHLARGLGHADRHARLSSYASMSGPTKELEKLVLGEQLNHGKNPVLRWMASNVSVEQDAAGNIKASKSKSNERIDGIVASVMLGLGVDLYTIGKILGHSNTQTNQRYAHLQVEQQREALNKLGALVNAV